MFELNSEQQVKLLSLARETIQARLDAAPEPVPDFNQVFADDIFRQKCGAFVTLHIKGGLRGCIGYIKGVKTIPETIIDMALAAAFQDPRFSPLKRAELSAVDIEISVLSPIERVQNIDDIVVGRDGIIISCGFRTGLLLPQVATEQNWDLPTFLEHTCFKAGLPGNAWQRKDTTIEKFSAFVFGEKELGLL